MEERKEETRMIGIKGIAAQDYLKAQGLRRSGGTRKARVTKQIGGFSEATNIPPGPPKLLSAANLSAAAALGAAASPTPTQKGGGGTFVAQTQAPQANPLQSSLPAIQAAAQAATLPPIAPSTQAKFLPPTAPMPPAPSNPIPVTQSGGGAAKEGGAKGVILEPAKKKQTSKLLLAPSSGSKKQPVQKQHQTRKIKVGLAGMKKRLTRAHKITTDSKQKSIEEIRKILEAAKLIRPNKTVPEDIIRNIYKDYMLLRGKAL
jgi:hypothetical protein